MTLSADHLLAKAQQQTGLSDFGPDDFREPLGLFINALNAEAEIAPDRAERLEACILRLLQNRLWFARDLAAHPEILDEDLGTPIVITSLPRTGSTKLHRKPDVLDLGFAQVAKDSSGAVAAVYDFLGMKLTDESRARMQAWEADEARNRHASASYSAEQYGTSEAAIREAFAGYIAQFAEWI